MTILRWLGCGIGNGIRFLSLKKKKKAYSGDWDWAPPPTPGCPLSYISSRFLTFICLYIGLLIWVLLLTKMSLVVEVGVTDSLHHVSGYDGYI